ncbi:UDP-N-acetylmuramoyl-tripeptide--D-alanyl-D-alanine ligase [Bacillus sp. Marseille-Q1617]|uniref:Mur ligase family protein n=1 Tax=Bacillus sp. Marseille-Q1617 TaxID=2736887 RepID=UPI00158BE172|nr:UDP-N-acetylmuramoyl-tripeptide--D-alanyl-D-alanine ligase [Bacillus sp. Marseille-Q1617]
MKPLPLREIMGVINGELVYGDDNFIVKDAMVSHLHRIKMRNTLIFLRKNEAFHVNKVIRYSPYIIVTDKSDEEMKASEAAGIVRVENVDDAFWAFTRYYRNLFDLPIVAITGTCGKTTTKEILSHLLSSTHSIQSTIRSRNATRKSFQYLMGIDETTDAAVFETGLRGPGNLHYHCQVFQPTIGILTTIGVDHLDKCKTLDGYIKAKSEIVKGVSKGGTLILNSEDENTKKVSLSGFSGQIIYCGTSKRADYRAADIVYGRKGMSFTLHHKNKTYRMYIPGFGKHQIYNALFALAAAHKIGLSLRKASMRLRTFKNLERHLQVEKGIMASTIIDDTWSTNPTSISAAIEVLERLGNDRKSVLVLGNIAYLGKQEKKIYHDLGKLIASKKIDTLIAVGKNTKQVADQAQKDGFEGKVYTADSPAHIKKYVANLLDEKTVLMIKGSMMDTELIRLASSFKADG